MRRARSITPGARLGMMIFVGIMLTAMLKLYHARPTTPKKLSRPGDPKTAWLISMWPLQQRAWSRARSELHDPRETAPIHHFSHPGNEFAWADRLLDAVVGAQFQRLIALLDVVNCRNEYDRHTMGPLIT